MELFKYVFNRIGHFQLILLTIIFVFRGMLLIYLFRQVIVFLFTLFT